MKKNDYTIVSAIIVFTVFTAIGIFSGCSYAREKPLSGSRYKIIQSLYLMAVYNDLNIRQLSRETARAYLHAEEYYNKSWVAFQCEVPAGTIVTIVSPAPKVWSLPFLANRYFVKLDPNFSRGLDVILELNRGIEGDMDGLNPKLFSRL